MQDEMIVDLYWQRNETAINETENKYGNYLFRIARNILLDREDSMESVNDTYLKAWDTMPPNRPGSLSVYLGRITRFISIDRLRKRTSLKRKASEYTIALSELEDCSSGTNATEASIDNILLTNAIGDYLKSLSEESRNMFIGRYYFLDSIREIAGYTKASESKVKVQLYRIRLELKEYLKKEGFDL